MNLSFVFTVGVILLILAIVSWTIPAAPRLITELLAWAFRLAGVYAYIVAILAVIAATLLIIGIVASVSIGGLIIVWVMIALTYLAIRFRTQILEWFHDHGISNSVLVAIAAGLCLLLLITTDAVFGRGFITAVCFLTVIVLTVIMYLPIGIVLKVLRLQGTILPLGLRMFISFLCFMAIFVLLYPGYMTAELGLIITLLAILLFVSATRSDFLKVAMTATILMMCFVAVWKSTAPDHFRSFTSYLDSKNEKMKAGWDQSALEDKEDIAATYAKANRSIKVMYEFALRPDGEIESLTAHFVANIAVDSILRVCDHKNNTRRFEGQEYLQLTLPNAYGTFLGGKKVWVEADFVDIITAQQYRAKMKLRQQYNKGGEEDGLAIIQKNSQPDTRKVSGYFPNPGRYALDIGQGEETGYITVGPCRSYMFNNGGDRIVLIYPDNSFARSWEINKWPDKVTFKVKNLSSRDDLALVIM